MKLLTALATSHLVLRRHDYNSKHDSKDGFVEQAAFTPHSAFGIGEENPDKLFPILRGIASTLDQEPRVEFGDVNTSIKEILNVQMFYVPRLIRRISSHQHPFSPRMSSNTMQAAILEDFGQPYVLKQIPRPSQPDGHDVLIKVLAASYCHTDAVFAAGALSKDLPRVGCHEFAGQIVALGDNVLTSLNLSPGIRVGVPGRAYNPCSTCYECTNPDNDPMGYSPFCPHAGNLGLTRDGGFQEYCLVDSRQVTQIPDGVPATQVAPLMCAGLTVWAALHHEKLRQAKKVAILGAGGGLGHLGVQFAAHLGFSVLAIDANDKSLAFLHTIKEGLGSAGDKVHVADVRNNDIASMRAMIGEAKDGVPMNELGLDATIILPESQAAFDTGMKLLKNHSTMVIVSFPQNGFHFSAHDLVFRDITLVGSLVGRNYQLSEMLSFCQKYGVSADVKTFPFKQINSLVEEYHKGVSGKLVIDMNL